MANNLRYRIFTEANLEDLEETVQDFVNELFDDEEATFLGGAVFADDPDDGPFVYQTLSIKTINDSYIEEFID